MEDQVLVKVEGLSKKFSKSLKKSLKYGVYDLLANLRGKEPSQDLRPDEFWALQDINFELRRGECLGLIGHNGAGKSTLLKILNGLINPDHGKVTMKGRVGALIELGAGFNPIMTGRENIYNNGAVLGFSRQEIDTKVEEIIDFSEIREFIDMPVQNYSSGMKVRLGFAVAAQMEPDILIIDEVLAVGDLSFRVKCYNTIVSLLPKTAIIFVSHSMPQVSKICTVGIMLNRGEVKHFSKDVSEVINTYFFDSSIEKKQIISGTGKTVLIDKSIFYKDSIIDANSVIIEKGDSFTLEMNLSIDSNVEKYIVRMVVYDSEFKGLLEINSLNEGIIFRNETNETSISVKINNPLNSGNYSITMILLEILDDGRIGERLLVYEGFMNFKSIDNSNYYENYIPITINSDWIIK